jgi:tetratricopeptide (TPR) repeat protein
MKPRFFMPGILSCLLTLGLSLNPVQAYTTSDYYNAGLKTYSDKNFTQAIQYFSTAISLDPNNPSSYMVRANCYYYLGQYPQALADYQKVQVLQPNDKIAAMIQNLQAKISSSTTLPASTFPALPAGSFDQGMAFFNQKQYLNALPMFQQSVRENPNDARIYYYLGVTQAMTGDFKDAAVNLTLYDKKQPNASIENYIMNIKTRLAPEDQRWVDAQAAASSNVASAGVSSPAPVKSFGIRLEPAVFMDRLADLNTDAKTNLKTFQQLQPMDPSLNFTASIPAGYFGGGVEPVLNLGSDFALGLPFAILPVGTATEGLQDNSGYNLSSSYDISAFSVGLDAWYFIPLGKTMQMFVSAGPLFVPISLNYQTNLTLGGGSPVTTTQTGTFSSTGMGGQFQIGLDWHLGDTIVISPMVGYQLASGNGFQGSLSSAINGTGTGSSQGQLELYSTPYGNRIGFFANNQTVPSGATLLTVDLSGLKTGLQLSAYF